MNINNKKATAFLAQFVSWFDWFWFGYKKKWNLIFDQLNNANKFCSRSQAIVSACMVPGVPTSITLTKMHLMSTCDANY